MRVALISIAESLPAAPGSDGGDQRRGLLQFAGESLAARQIAHALQLGCERIVGLTRGIPNGHLGLQQSSEAGGAQFQLVESVTQLSGLVRAADDLFVFAEGAMLPPDAVALLDARSGVLVIAADKGVPAGFERVDADLAWGGLLRGSGSMVERLADLPPDIEPVSAMLRIALQSGSRTVPVVETALEDGSLAMIESTLQASHAEDIWLRRKLRLRSWFAPGLALADRVVERYAAKLLGLDPAGWRGAAVVLALAIAAITGSAFLQSATGFAILSIAAFIGVITSTATRLTAKDSTRAKVRPTAVVDWTIDLSIIAVPLVAMLPDFSAPTGFALAAMIGVLLLAERLANSPRLAMLGDRVLLCIALAIASAFGFLLPAVQALALVVLASALVITRGHQR